MVPEAPKAYVHKHGSEVPERLHVRKLSKRLDLAGYPLSSAYPCKARSTARLLLRITQSVGTPGRQCRPFTNLRIHEFTGNRWVRASRPCWLGECVLGGRTRKLGRRMAAGPQVLLLNRLACVNTGCRVVRDGCVPSPPNLVAFWFRDCRGLQYFKFQSLFDRSP